MPDEKPQNLEEYRAAIKSAFDNESAQVMLNSSKYHAMIIIEAILAHAQNNVKIFCRQLAEDVWGESRILDAIFDAIIRNVKIEICTQEAVAESSRKNSLCNLGIALRENIRKDILFNFVVADKKMFRYEPDAAKRCAIACANDSTTAEMLDNFFAECLAK